MSALDLKIPPPVVALAVALLMWVVAGITPEFALPTMYRIAGALTLALAGFGVRAVAQLSLLRAQTTVNPMGPRNTSALVSEGIYRFTRNPMYLGRFLQLAAWAVFLSNVFAALLMPVYVLYIDRFQFRAEERALLQRFGQRYVEYRQTVPRWL